MTAIEFNHVGKQYRLGLVGTGTLSQDLNRWWQTAVLHHEDPYLKIGDVNDRAAKANSDFVWALRDIDFKVEEGDVVGIIGKNGAGKSTLLKLLSRVTTPTVGTINYRGRLAALLEVGTGFHGEMTGRENIYMNGAILGMTKAEIDRKLDEIIDFSGCEKYIDTPVKRYSSGMTVRLGFAVAAFLEPEILIVDEVLAVGDAEFQKKAIGKMQDVAGHGRTVLFVSHNMASIRNLCRSGVVLDKGCKVFEGTATDAISYYKSISYLDNEGRNIVDFAFYQKKSIQINHVFANGKENSCVSLEPGDNKLSIVITGHNDVARHMALEVRLLDENDFPLAMFLPNEKEELPYFDEGDFKIQKDLVFPKGVVSGTYYLSMSLVHPLVEGYVDFERAIKLQFGGTTSNSGQKYSYSRGMGWIQL